MTRFISIASLLIFLMPPQAYSQNVCGSPPELPMKAGETDRIKGNLEGKAQFLSRLVGDASLAGNIENERQTIYQSSDKIFAAQQDAFLLYMFCISVMGDKSLSTQDKITAIRQYKQPLQRDFITGPPPPKRDFITSPPPPPRN